MVKVIPADPTVAMVCIVIAAMRLMHCARLFPPPSSSHFLNTRHCPSVHLLMQKKERHLEEYYRRFKPDMKFMDPLLSVLDIEHYGVAGRLRKS